MENSTNHQWTTIFLIKTDESLWNQSTQMLDDLLTLAIRPETALIICLCGETGYLQTIDPTLHFPPGEDVSTVRTAFYSMEPLAQPAGGRKSMLQRIGRDSKFDIMNPGHISKFFTRYVLGGYSAKKYLLFTWGHGATYGMYPRNIPKTEPGETPRPLKWNMLSIAGLAGAIKSSFGNRPDQKVNVVIMMNCYMHLFDTGLTLAGAGVDFLVAAENTESAVGYNYKAIFGRLFNHPAIRPEALAKLAVISLKKMRYPNKAENARDPLQDTAFFANDLRLYAGMAVLLDKLSILLTDRLNNHFKDIDDAVNFCDYCASSTYPVKDLFRFLQQIRARTSRTDTRNAAVHDLIERIDGLRKRLVLQKYWGAVLKATQPNKYPLGCSISLPEAGDASKAFYITYMQQASPYATDFSKDYHWSVFVKKYLKLAHKDEMFSDRVK